MPLTDLPLEDLLTYRGEVAEPADFDEFWVDSLEQARAHDIDVARTPVTGHGLARLEVEDVRFSGWGGQRIAAWLVRPRGEQGPLPIVVHVQGYSQGRGVPVQHTQWAAAGFAHLVVDSRGQGHDTPDAGSPETTGSYVGGVMTKGIEDPRHHYFRRAMVDCARAVDAAHALDGVDGRRVVVAGGSQGGGFTLAAAGLCGDAVAAALPDVPFLCHYRRGAETASAGPYLEVVEYLRRHTRTSVEQAFRTLAYVDAANLAVRATAPALFSVALMDPVCPPSTVFAAYARYGEAVQAVGREVDKEIAVWPFGDHAGGGADQFARQLQWLGARGFLPGS
ncbi:prolyl oligopeptidase family serine peptidase [Kineococcus sp. R8]|uniref:acetylxylan esterase n=1 Tax=Kineococcus siccus TaxID=2696567 RepID=UPI001411BF65|nr:prolyl oligopeptidase family serine peptidase [Kineococcus siccus]